MGKKPLDALFKDMDNAKDKFFAAIDSVVRNKSLDPYIKTLIDKIEGLESELCELKNICSKDQLIELSYILKRNKEQSNEINDEVAIERGNEVEINNNKKGAL